MCVDVAAWPRLPDVLLQPILAHVADVGHQHGPVWDPQPMELRFPGQQGQGGIMVIGYNWGGPGNGPAYQDLDDPADPGPDRPMWNPGAVYDRRALYIIGGGNGEANAKAHQILPFLQAPPNYAVSRTELHLWPSANADALAAFALPPAIMAAQRAILAAKIAFIQPQVILAVGQPIAEVLPGLPIGGGTHIEYVPNLGGNLNRHYPAAYPNMFAFMNAKRAAVLAAMGRAANPPVFQPDPCLM